MFFEPIIKFRVKVRPAAFTPNSAMLHCRFTKIDHSANIRRYYVISVERDLFGEACVVKTWGRIGTKGRAKVTRYASERAAENAARSAVKRRRKRGYLVAP